MHRRSDGKTKVLLQVLDFLTIRRRPPKEKFFSRFLAVTDRHTDGIRERFGAEAAADEAAVVEAMRAQLDDALVQRLVGAPDGSDAHAPPGRRVFVPHKIMNFVRKKK